MWAFVDREPPPRTGNFDRARRLLAGEVTCPHCGAADLPAPASPTLEPEQDGSLTCTMCATNFRPTTDVTKETTDG